MDKQFDSLVILNLKNTNFTNTKTLLLQTI